MRAKERLRAVGLNAVVPLDVEVGDAAAEPEVAEAVEEEVAVAEGMEEDVVDMAKMMPLDVAAECWRGAMGLGL